MDGWMVKDGSGLVSPCLPVCAYTCFFSILSLLFEMKSRWTSQDLYGYDGMAYHVDKSVARTSCTDGLDKKEGDGQPGRSM